MILRGKKFDKWLDTIHDKAFKGGKVLKIWRVDGRNYEYSTFKCGNTVFYAIVVLNEKWNKRDIVVSEDMKEVILAEIL